MSDSARMPTVPPPPAGVGPPQHRAPEREQGWTVPWGVLDCLAVLGVTAVASLALVILLASVVPDVTPGWLRGVLLPLPLAVLAVATVGWIHFRYRAAGRLAGPVRASARDWLVGFGWGVGMFFAVNVAVGLLVQLVAWVIGVELPQPQEDLRQVATEPTLVPWLVVAAVVVAPLAEEVFFRGMLFQTLRRRRGPRLAIVLSAAAFALAHILQEATAPAGALVIFLILPVGILLGWAFERRGTLAVPIAAHAGFNLTTTALVLLGAYAGVVAS